MKQIRFNYSNFGAGLVTDLDPSRMSSGCTPDCDNITVDTGTIKVRPGLAYAGSINTTQNMNPTGALALAEFYDNDNQLARLAGVTGVYPYISDTYWESVRNLLGDGTSNNSLSPAGARMLQFKDKLYMCDGVHNVYQSMCKPKSRYKYGNSISCTVGSSVNQFGRLGDNSHLVSTGMAFDGAGNMYVCDPAKHRIVRFLPDGTYNGWIGKGSDGTSGVHDKLSSVIPISAADVTGFNNPMDLSLSYDGTSGSWRMAVADSGNKRVQVFGLENVNLGQTLSASLIFSLTTTKNKSSDSTFYAFGAVRCVQFLPEGDYIAVGGSSSNNNISSLILYTRTGAWSSILNIDGGNATYPSVINDLALGKTDGIVYAAIGCPSVWEPLYDGVAKFSCLGSISLLETWHVGRAYSVTYDTVNDNILTICEGARVGYPESFARQVTVINEGGIHTSLMSIPAESAYIEFYNNTLYIGSDAAEVIYTCKKQDVGSLYDINIVKDLPTPTSAPDLSYSGKPSTSDKVEVAYTYAELVDPDTMLYREGKLSPSAYASIDITAGSMFIQAIPPPPYISDFNNATPDKYKMRMYMKSVMCTSWSLMGEVTCNGNDYSSCVLIDLPTSDPILLSDVSGAPPEAVSLMMEWRGHMVYVKDDTLYISAYGDPTSVSLIEGLDESNSYGLTVKVGNDSSPITGIGKLGTYLIVFKSHAIWMASGDITDTDFAINQISSSIGCCSHDTIAEIDGQIIAWLDKTGVWSFDGQNFSELSRNIRPTVSAINLTSAKSVYDKVNKRYILVYPEANGTEYGSAALVWQKQRYSDSWSWTKWSNIPMASMLYADYAPTPGVYFGVSSTSFILLLKEDSPDYRSAHLDYATIIWSWASRYVTDPSLSELKQISWMQARTIVKSGNHSVTIGVCPNGDGVASNTKPLSVSVGSEPVPTVWRPPYLSPSRGIQILVSGSSTAGMQIADIIADVSLRGRV